MHPDRRREGRRLRTQRRQIERAMPTMLTIADEVQNVDWDAAYAAIGKALTDLGTAAQTVGVWILDTVAEVVNSTICPDCRDGKHAACTGLSWSVELDTEVVCSCHEWKHAHLPVAPSHHSMIGTTNPAEGPNEGTP